MTNDELTEVTSAATLAFARQATSELLGEGDPLSAAALSNRGWVAVPVESAAHFDTADTRRLASAAALLGCGDCLIVLAEPLTGAPFCLRAPLTDEGLTQFSERCSHFEYVLLPESALFCVLCTVREYFLVAGPRDFVEHAVGATLEEARAAFAAFATDPDWPQATGEHLRDVSSRYR